MEQFLGILLMVLSWWGGLSSSPAPVMHSGATTTATVTAVIDGDTIDVQFGTTTARVRYIGIDTPEPYRAEEPACFSTEASAANRQLVAGKQVTLVADQEDTDKYDRLLRYVYVDEVMVNAELVRGGYATTLPIKPNTTHASEFLALQQAAKQAGLGLWGSCQ